MSEKRSEYHRRKAAEWNQAAHAAIVRGKALLAAGCNDATASHLAAAEREEQREAAETGGAS